MITVVALLLAAVSQGLAQTGQPGARPGWPCVPGRAVDPTYLEVSESTGGQTFLLQKGEAGHAGVIMSMPFTHPDTVFRAVGHLAGSRTIEFPVDTSVESLLVTASIQCRQTVALIDPGGSEVTAANAIQNIDLQAGKILRLDGPGAGNYQVRIAGQGLFILSVMAKTAIRLSSVRFVETGGPLLGVPQQLRVHVLGPLTKATFHMAAASGEILGELTGSPGDENGDYLLEATPMVERFRIMAEGVDETGRPVRRMYPNLFQAKNQK
jgi:hypothetical protein